MCFHPTGLSTEFVHNHVDRCLPHPQSLKLPKGLRRSARLFANPALERNVTRYLR
jgi:hypothetical protein